MLTKVRPGPRSPELRCVRHVPVRTGALAVCLLGDERERRDRSPQNHGCGLGLPHQRSGLGDLPGAADRTLVHAGGCDPADHAVSGTPAWVPGDTGKLTHPLALRSRHTPRRPGTERVGRCRPFTPWALIRLPVGARRAVRFFAHRRRRVKICPAAISLLPKLHEFGVLWARRLSPRKSAHTPGALAAAQVRWPGTCTPSRWMASRVALARCRQCEEHRAAYERTTAERMQAEAEFLWAVHSRNAVAIQTAANALRAALMNWRDAHNAMRRHELGHQRDWRLEAGSAS